MTDFSDAKQLFTTLTDDGRLILTIEPDEPDEPDEPSTPDAPDAPDTSDALDAPGAPAGDEIIVRMEAVPINPSDLGLLLAPADMSTLRRGTVEGHPALVADVPPERARFFAGRTGQKLSAGNEGAGTVVAAGSSDAARALMGRTVSLVGGGLYRTHARTTADRVVPLPEGAPAREGASLFVNPMTVQGFLNTRRAEGHAALVHTAAASNLGRMLAKLCLKEDVPLVAIVRSEAQKEILTGIGLTHVVDSSQDDFMGHLVDALADTGATLAFDAIGGGRMASDILTAMERAQARRGAEVTVYGTTVPKQVYIYGRLDTGDTILAGGYGMTWGVGGWLLGPHLQAVGPERTMEMRRFAVAERNGIFASHYTRTISLQEMIDPEIARAYQRKATGEKYLVDPSR